MKLKLKEIIKVILFIHFLIVIGCNSGANAIIAPSEVSNSMTQMYPNISNIKWIKGNMNIWQANFKNNNIETAIIFDSLGALKLKIEQIPFNETPENIHTYFNSNSGLKKLEQVEKVTDAVDLSFYKAKLNDSNISYYFDVNGTFIHMSEGDDDDMKMEIIDNKITSQPNTKNIKITDLPVGILNFIAHSHTGYMIENAHHKTLCDGTKAIEVKVLKENANIAEDYSLSIIFSINGEYIRTEQEIDLNNIPDLIKKEIEDRFKDFEPTSKAQLLTFTRNDETQYLIHLNQGNSTKDVVFKNDGEIVCQTEN